MRSSHESNKDLVDNLSMGSIVRSKRSLWLIKKDGPGGIVVNANRTAVCLRYEYVGDDFVYIYVLYKQQRLVAAFPSNKFIQEWLEVL